MDVLHHSFGTVRSALSDLPGKAEPFLAAPWFWFDRESFPEHKDANCSFLHIGFFCLPDSILPWFWLVRQLDFAEMPDTAAHCFSSSAGILRKTAKSFAAVISLAGQECLADTHCLAKMRIPVPCSFTSQFCGSATLYRLFQISFHLFC
ncbi:hypothetical protein [Ruminococcus sp.]